MFALEASSCNPTDDGCRARIASAAPCARGCPLWSPQVSDSLLREQACCGSRAELLLLALLLAFHQLALLGLQNPFRECYLAQALCVGLAFDRLGHALRVKSRISSPPQYPVSLGPPLLALIEINKNKNETHFYETQKQNQMDPGGHHNDRLAPDPLAPRLAHGSCDAF